MPSLLTPDSGLLFWMLIAFLTVFIILAKYGFPAITKMVEDRKRFIDESLQNARKANEKLANIKMESEAILKETREQQTKILREAMATRDSIIKEAKEKAFTEGQKLLDEAKIQIQAEKEIAMRDVRTQIIKLSVEVAEKVLRKDLDEQSKQANHLDDLLNELADK